MSRNIVFEGWLTKSPPAKRIWRAKWRRRWFSLRQSSELPGQYFLDYYADRNCRRLKGTIDLDLCEQVDAGLHMERGNGALDPKIRGSGFTIRTQSRTYYLEADCEADMEKWVDIICRVCGLRSTTDTNDEDYTGPYHANGVNTIAVINERFDRTITTGPYIPISECITGARLKDNKGRLFVFDTKNIVTSNRQRVCSARFQQMVMNQPHIRLHPPEFSEPDSALSDEDCKSLRPCQCSVGEWSVAKSFTKLSVSPRRNCFSEDGPPVPPRPAKTLTMPRENYHNLPRESYHKEANTFIGPKIQEPMETHIEMQEMGRYLRVPGRQSHSRSPSSPGRLPLSVAQRYTDDEDENAPANPQTQVYFNIPNLPQLHHPGPAVDRALKPRRPGQSFGQNNNLINNNQHLAQNRMSEDEPEKKKSDVLQYLDLDLPAAKPPSSQPQDMPNGQRALESTHRRTKSEVDADAYKTVDFAKTEAFNITRKDAEAHRLMQQ